MASTRLAGHGLQSEGKPYIPGGGGLSDEPWIRPRGRQPDGVALCECGWTSPELNSDGRRKRAHRVHKSEIRKKVRNGG